MPHRRSARNARLRALILIAAGLIPALPAAAQELNKMCPVLQDEQADPDITVTYQGKKIAFCCDKCVAKFNADPQKYLAHLPQFAAAPQDQGSPPGGESVAARTFWPRLKNWLGRLHPIIVHFPLAGIPLALLGYLIWLFGKRDDFFRADVPALAASAAAAVCAYITGNLLEESTRFSEALQEVVERHETLSTLAMIMILCLLALRIWRWNKLHGYWPWVYGAGLVLTVCLLAWTGMLGGSLVFGQDHLAF